MRIRVKTQKRFLPLLAVLSVTVGLPLQRAVQQPKVDKKEITMTGSAVEVAMRPHQIVTLRIGSFSKQNSWVFSLQAKVNVTVHVAGV
jgi:hypothetical protein